MGSVADDTCTWIPTKDPDGDEFWETACGQAFCFDNDGPRENHYCYCPYCGKRLVEGKNDE